MTPRERMQSVVTHQRPDRTPAVLGNRPEMDRALMAYLGAADMGQVARILGADGWGGVGLGISFPGWAQRVNGRLEGDMPYAGQSVVFHDARTFEDEWGVVRRVGRDGKYVEWIAGPLMQAQNPDECDFPGPDRIVPHPDLAGAVAAQKAAGLWVAAAVTMPYKTAWELRGMENLLADYALNPAFVEALYDRIFATYGEILVRCAAAGVDQVGFGGDIAMQDRVIMGPARWRAIDKPRLAAVIARCRQVNPGVHAFIHSDGDLTAIMDDLLEIGFDIIDPIQPECMDPRQVKVRWGDRMVLHGCGSLQRTLPFGTAADCRREVQTLIRTCGHEGGLVLRISNAVGFDVPVENVVAWFEAARDFDMSALP
jgi:uroporphyrinogen decarboxylase